MRHLPVVRPGQARKAAEFYAAMFPDSHVGTASPAPWTIPTVGGRRAHGRVHRPRPAVPRPERRPQFQAERGGQLQVFTDDQEETDRYWNAIVGNGGAGERVRLVQGPLGLLVADHARALMRRRPIRTAAAKRAIDAMMTMRKIDIATIEAARARRDRQRITGGVFQSLVGLMQAPGALQPCRRPATVALHFDGGGIGGEIMAFTCPATQEPDNPRQVR